MDKKLGEVVKGLAKEPQWLELVEGDVGQSEVMERVVVVAERVQQMARTVDLLVRAHLAELPASSPTQMLCALFEREAATLEGGEIGIGDSGGEVVARWREILAWEDPFAVMGACYLCKTVGVRWLTVIEGQVRQVPLSESMREMLLALEKSQRRKAALLRALIEDLKNEYPQIENALAVGFGALLEVYPQPFWKGLLEEVGESSLVKERK